MHSAVGGCNLSLGAPLASAGKMRLQLRVCDAIGLGQLDDLLDRIGLLSLLGSFDLLFQLGLFCHQLGEFAHLGFLKVIVILDLTIPIVWSETELGNRMNIAVTMPFTITDQFDE